jgi:hypothetical protein
MIAPEPFIPPCLSPSMSLRLRSGGIEREKEKPARLGDLPAAGPAWEKRERPRPPRPTIDPAAVEGLDTPPGSPWPDFPAARPDPRSSARIAAS